MSLQEICDAIARQAAVVEGIKLAFATGVGGQGASVNRYPDDLSDGPAAVVDYAGTDVLSVPPFERLGHDFDVGIWMPRGNGTREAAVAALAPMFDRFLAAFRQNVGLYGTAITSQVLGSTGFDDSTFGDGDQPFVVQTIRIRAQVARSVTPAMGPAS